MDSDVDERRRRGSQNLHFDFDFNIIFFSDALCIGQGQDRVPVSGRLWLVCALLNNYEVSSLTFVRIRLELVCKTSQSVTERASLTGCACARWK